MGLGQSTDGCRPAVNLHQAQMHFHIDWVYSLVDCFFFFFLGLFILRETETARVGKGQRERGRERIPGRLRATCVEHDVGLEVSKAREHDLSQNQESDA